MLLKVTNSKTGDSLVFDGRSLGGSPAAMDRAAAMVQAKQMISGHHPTSPPVQASLAGDSEVLLATLRHAVAPGSPFAGFVTVEFDNGKPKKPTGGASGPKVKSVAPMLLNTRIPLTPEVVEFKSGLISAHDRLTQAAQGVVSTAIPGDMSDVRNPIRSAVWEALTPGGGRDNRRNRLGRAIGRAAERVRCPAGYENGGKFSDRGFTNCGRRIFEALTDDRTNADILRSLNPNATPGQVRRIGDSGFIGRAVQIVRNAKIPPPGKPNPGRRDSVVSRTAATLSRSATPDDRLVRADGYVLKASVPVKDLLKIRRNPDMDDATYVTRGPDVRAAELPVRTQVRSVVFAMSGGKRSTLERTRPLTQAEQRKVTRALAGPGSFDEVLQGAVAASGGALSYRSDIKGTDPASRLARRLDGGADPMSVKARDLGAALELSKYKREQAKPGVAVYSRGDKRFYALDTTDREHLAHVTAAEVQRHLGLATPRAKRMDEGETPRVLIDVTGDIPSGNADRDAVAIHVADWLLDQRTRSPETVVDGDRLIPTDHDSGSLAGLSASEMADRRKLDIEAFFDADRKRLFSDRFANMTEKQRQILMGMYDDMLKRAMSFDWVGYMKRLGLDGDLSANEKAHLSVVRSMYDSRLESLRKARERFTDLIGAE
jgi:hypothetical protein